MSETRADERRTPDAREDINGHLWLEAIQDNLLERLSRIEPGDTRPAAERKVLPIDGTDPREKRPKLVERLKQRKIVQWLVGYLAVGWMILQLNDVLASVWGIPVSAQKAISLALGVGVFPALVVAWYHGEKGRQRVCCAEIGLVGLTTAIAIATVWQVCFP